MQDSPQPHGPNLQAIAGLALLRESYMEVSLREMGLMEKKRKQRRVFLRRSAGSKTVRGRTSCCPLEGKEQRIREKKQPEEPENTAPVLYISHIPHASMSTRCKVSQ
ncbi:uncharacterized protein LOC125515452 [Triticum urartu]|uniref:uncharacterized protein LOC125515452 n=1 Tax=Triticum urartu TaxID=4572 RepID=UPI0020434A92|nr:uncharacterized protein LOC125515452 [Triticum urartu]